MKNLIYLLIAALLFTFTACSEDDENPVAGTTYKISGTVTTPDGAGLAGATVNLTGADTETATSDANGKYEFLALDAGDYIVTATSTEYDFIQPVVTITGLAKDEIADFAAKEGIVGTWLSTGTNIAPLLQQLFANGIDSIFATFQTNQVYEVRQVQTDGSVIAYVGTYTVQKSSVGNIYTITIGQTSPSVATVEGIYEVDRTQTPQFLKYEVVQTEPPAGTPATPEAGFGSTNGGFFNDDNIQKYIKMN
ncbi:MAG: carboxypeptidase regulatory-like domain-containing protein [Ignavibacteriae bacterium]|nr:carboxypeptidase regulatory-like domain-containing protein [Ignavibacteriota bacterium]NOG97821.1 carboxypeptidase regulatory-like domain-containing protein [Ignavibacteriota bacterium]